MMTLFKTQSGIPKPAVDRSPKNPRRKWPVDTMPAGDVFFLPGRTTKSVSAYLSRVSKPLKDKKFSAIHCWMREVKGGWELAEAGDAGAVEGVGVWRDE